MTRVTLLIFVSFLAACAPKAELGFDGNETVGILGGQEVKDPEPLAETTVGLYDSRNGSKCTGSLLSDSLILTAAHCVEPGSDGLFVVFAKNFYVGNKLNKEKMVKVERFQRHSSYNPNRTEGVDTFDLALVKFSGGLPPGYRIVQLSSNVEKDLSQMGNLMALGYGVSNGFFNTGAGILRKAELQFSKMHSATEFRTVQGQTGVCSGDSGGPLYKTIHGSSVQLGVASRVASKVLTCRDYAVYTRVDLYQKWIEETSTKLMSEMTE